MPKPPQDEEIQLQRPWRLFAIPRGHVFVVDRIEDDETTVHIRAPSAVDADAEQLGTFSHQQQAEGTRSMVYDCGPYGALFMLQADEEGVLVPVPWPTSKRFERVTAAVLEEKEPPLVIEPAAPESFTLSPDVVAFYRPATDEMALVLIAASDDVEYVKLAEKESARPVRSLTLRTRSIVSTSFRSCPDVQFKENRNLIAWFY